MPGSPPTWYLTHEYVGRNQTCDLQELVGGLRSSTALHSFHVDGLAEVFGNIVWDPFIPHRTAIAEAQDRAMPVHVVPALTREVAWIYDSIADRLEKTLS